MCMGVEVGDIGGFRAASDLGRQHVGRSHYVSNNHNWPESHPGNN